MPSTSCVSKLHWDRQPKRNAYNEYGHVPDSRAISNWSLHKRFAFKVMSEYLRVRQQSSVLRSRPATFRR
eukprot:2574831-Pyramimonas_sp.AAC.1